MVSILPLFLRLFDLVLESFRHRGFSHFITYFYHQETSRFFLFIGFNADNHSNVRFSRYSRYASSTQLSGSYIDLYNGLTLVKCAFQCRRNDDCRVFSFKLNECKLYAIYTSGICYAVANGLQSSIGEDVYISR